MIAGGTGQLNSISDITRRHVPVNTEVFTLCWFNVDQH